MTARHRHKCRTPCAPQALLSSGAHSAASAEVQDGRRYYHYQKIVIDPSLKPAGSHALPSSYEPAHKGGKLSPEVQKHAKTRKNRQSSVTAASTQQARPIGNW